MALTGNHGRIIPLDYQLLHRMYWDDEMGLVDIAKVFGVNPKSVLSTLRRLGIPTRAKGTSKHRTCVDCGDDVYKVAHKLAKNGYGTRCRACRRKHYAALSRAYIKLPKVAAYRKAYMDNWKLTGNKNPQGELQWIKKARIMFRTTKRILNNPAALQSLSEEFAQDQTSRA